MQSGDNPESCVWKIFGYMTNIVKLIINCRWGNCEKQSWLSLHSREVDLWNQTYEKFLKALAQSFKRKLFNPIHRSAGSVHDNITGRGMLKSLKHRPGHTCIDPRDFAKLNATCFAIQPARRWTFFLFTRCMILDDRRCQRLTHIFAVMILLFENMQMTNRAFGNFRFSLYWTSSEERDIKPWISIIIACPPTLHTEPKAINRPTWMMIECKLSNFI